MRHPPGTDTLRAAWRNAARKSEEGVGCRPSLRRALAEGTETESRLAVCSLRGLDDLKRKGAKRQWSSCSLTNEVHRRAKRVRCNAVLGSPIDGLDGAPRGEEADVR